MMLNLNFLPQKLYRNLKLYALLAWVKSVLRSSIIILFAFDTFLLLIYFVLSEQTAMLEKRADELNQSYTYYNQRVEMINRHIAAVNQAGSNYGLLTPRFWSIISTLPGNIQLKNLNLSLEQNNRVVLNGIAESREALLQYEQILGKISWVEKVYLPTSQLLQKDNINFSIEISAKPPTPDEYLGNKE